MKNILIAAISILVISFTSCKKEEIVEPKDCSIYTICELSGPSIFPDQYGQYEIDIVATNDCDTNLVINETMVCDSTSDIYKFAYRIQHDISTKKQYIYHKIYAKSIEQYVTLRCYLGQ
jgi:hypothetical protein